MIILRLTCLTSALSLAAAASKSAKTPGTPAPTDASKAGKSSKSTTSHEYFIAPFSCPQKCIDAHGYEPSSHLLEDAVSECDASDSYQKWKVHRVGGFLKFESAAQHDHNMCLAVVHQDSDHESNTLQWDGVADPLVDIDSLSVNLDELGLNIEAPQGVLPNSVFEIESVTFSIGLGTSASYPILLSENDVDGILAQLREIGTCSL